MTPKERAAMQQALEALVDHGTAYLHHEVHYSEAITALREALAEQAEQEPVAKYYGEKLVKGSKVFALLDRDLAPDTLLYAAPQPVSQEPMYISKYCVKSGCACHYSTAVDGEPVAVYAAPVRTKDLTDDEIKKVWNKKREIFSFARAVIAKFKEKNK